jgi:hypothetical protein
MLLTAVFDNFEACCEVAHMHWIHAGLSIFYPVAL